MTDSLPLWRKDWETRIGRRSLKSPTRLQDCEAGKHLPISTEIEQLEEEMDVPIVKQPIKVISSSRYLLGAVL